MVSQASSEKRALVIGVNRYPRLAARYQLSGCVNDAELMAQVLQENLGFRAENVTVLRDGQATREGILAAMDELVEQAGADDIVVIHYSGHGSRMRDREGDEPDGYDETIVPYDSGRAPHPNRDITDDEIYLRLLRLSERTPYITLIFDCCHSGTISRDAFGEVSRAVEDDERPIEELPPSPIPEQGRGGAARDVGPSGWLPLGQRYVLIAGCRDDESSYEHRVSQGQASIKHGALTYFLTQELVRAEPGATYRDVFGRLEPQVTAAHPRQHPQMEGARDRELFGVRTIQPLRYVSVTRRLGPMVELAAGAAHGMTVGSTWAVYPQGTTRVTEDTPCLGTAQITAVRAVSSDARLSDEIEEGAIAQGARAVEESHAYGDMQLAVQVDDVAGDDASASELEVLIEASDLLRLAEDEGMADVRAYILPARCEAAEGDPVPQVKQLDEPTWVVVGRDGLLMMPTHAVAEPEAAETLRDNLEKAARYRQALALRNPNPDSLLQGTVGFVLKRQKGGDWVDAEPDTLGGEVVFDEGDRVAFEITNRYSAPIYVSVLDFGLTGAIGQLHPIEGANEKLLPGHTIEVGVRDGDEVTLSLPEDYPYAPDPNDETSIGGVETFKLIVATHELDISALTQPGYRDIDRAEEIKGLESPLGQLLDLAMTGQGTRDARRNRLPPDEEWTTVERTFLLQRGAL